MRLSAIALGVLSLIVAGSPITTAVVAQADVTITQITDTVGCGNEYPTFEASSNQFVFESNCDYVPGGNADQSSELFLAATDGSDIAQLTAGTGGIGNVWVNASGRKIVFSTTRDLVPGENADGNSEIFIMDVDGRNLRQLTHTTGANEHGTANYFPTIDYAGKRVFYVTDLDDTGTPSDQHSIMFVNADGSGLRRLIDGSHPSVDAKGNVYFARGGTSLFRMQPDGTGVVGLPEVTTFGIERTGPDAAGARLAFGSVGIDGRQDVFVLDIKTGVTTQVTSTPGDVGLGCRQPSLSPDGGTIVFSCDANLTGSNPDRNREIFVATLR